MTRDISLIGAPIQTGTHQPGCLMGPDALRTAGLAQALRDLGHSVRDLGNAAPADHVEITHPNAAIHDLAEIAAWCSTLSAAASAEIGAGRFPVFLGGDHSMSAGTVAGVASAAARAGRPQFVLWLDAHPDLHTLDSTASGNLHGTPVAYFTGQPGFEDWFPPLAAAVHAENVCMFGIRSVDPAEHRRISDTGMMVHDMRALDETGVVAPLRAFLERIAKANGALHVSLDVDFLDPGIAPAVGTTVPGGATFREAHLIMEMLFESGLVTSLDLVELNPFLDERGRTATLMVDLCASLMGRRVLDRPTRSYA